MLRQLGGAAGRALLLRGSRGPAFQAAEGVARSALLAPQCSEPAAVEGACCSGRHGPMCAHTRATARWMSAAADAAAAAPQADDRGLVIDQSAVKVS